MNTNNNKYLSVELEVEQLAEFMFIRNVNNSIIELSLGGIESTKDLFFFILDLFCKGLIILYGDHTNRVELDNLTIEKFNTIKDKMKCAGIMPYLDFVMHDRTEQDEDDQKIRYVNINMADLHAAEDMKPLTSYVFKIDTPEISYSLYFDLVHAVSLD